MQIRIGTRKSKLALIQTNMVVEAINRSLPEAECVIVPIVTTGDKITDKNLYDIGGKALFLKELEDQLLNKQIDLAAHSLKDVPGVLPENLTIAAVLERLDPRDCFVSLQYKSINELPIGGVVGSSSVRRKVILQQQRPDLKIVQFRGNVETRIAKLENQEVDATILACAGLKRAGLFDNAYCYPIEPEQMLPAAGQGIIGVEIRSDDKEMLKLCQQINHQDTWHLALAERSFLTYLDASCRTPLAAYASFDDARIVAKYMLSDIAGNSVRYTTLVDNRENAQLMGEMAAKELGL